MPKMSKMTTGGTIECSFDVVFSRGKYKLRELLHAFKFYSVVYWCARVAVLVN